MADFSLEINIFAFILMRMTGMIMTNPLIGRSTFPRLFKAGLILVYTILVYTYTDVNLASIQSFPEYVLLLMKEFFIGFAVGMTVNIFIYVIMFAGEQIDMQIGVSMSAVYDPGSNIAMSTSGTFYNILLILTFFSTDSHLTMIRLILDSSKLAPYGSIVINTQLSETILDIFCQCTILGMKMALPLIFMELLVEIAVGTMMKAIPQIDIFVVNIQMKLLIGILLIFITFQPISDFMEQLITLMFEGMKQVLIVMSG
ncbi:MAG: flagellar biosynthetic protein FliR [Firmicutes bacterium]|nr:flagellar biosynthetic protein FliR [Bacillota bacterium]